MVSQQQHTIVKALAASFTIFIVIICIFGGVSNNYNFAKYSTIAIGYISVFFLPFLLYRIVTNKSDGADNKLLKRRILSKFSLIFTLASIIVAFSQLSSISSKKNKQNDSNNKNITTLILIIATLVFILLAIFSSIFEGNLKWDGALIMLSIGIIVCSVHVKKTINSQVSPIR